MYKLFNSNFPKERIILIDKNKFYCRICGLEQLEAPWGDDDKTANFEICGCCGCEFGCDDYNIDVIREYRKQWLSGKLKWQNNVSYLIVGFVLVLSLIIGR